MHVLSIGCDLGRFITALYDVRSGFLLTDGTYHIRNAKDLAPDLFQRAHAQILKFNELFKQREMIPDHSAGTIAPYENQLGRALKYFAAWDVVSNAVLEESAFASLPHILEGGN